MPEGQFLNYMNTRSAFPLWDAFLPTLLADVWKYAKVFNTSQAPLDQQCIFQE